MGDGSASGDASGTAHGAAPQSPSDPSPSHTNARLQRHMPPQLSPTTEPLDIPSRPLAPAPAGDPPSAGGAEPPRAVTPTSLPAPSTASTSPTLPRSPGSSMNDRPPGCSSPTSPSKPKSPDSLTRAPPESPRAESGAHVALRVQNITQALTPSAVKLYPGSPVPVASKVQSPTSPRSARSSHCSPRLMPLHSPPKTPPRTPPQPSPSRRTPPGPPSQDGLRTAVESPMSGTVSKDPTGLVRASLDDDCVVLQMPSHSDLFDGPATDAEHSAEVLGRVVEGLRSDLVLAVSRAYAKGCGVALWRAVEGCRGLWRRVAELLKDS